jgi:predicted nucleic acid-binding protein
VVNAVIDTNILFAGLTDGDVASDLVVEAWRATLFRPCVSTALALEYESTLSKKLAAQRWEQMQPILSTLLDAAVFVHINFTWRPASSDPGDDFVIDCALNANAMIVTQNKRDFRLARRELGLQVMSADDFVALLIESD